MASKVSQICEEKLKSIIEEMGYELLEVEFAKKIDGMNLSFIIDSENGILIEDCEKVHRTIDPILEELNPTEDKPYILNVCSRGLDRPLKTDRDFNRNIGKKIIVTLYQKDDGTKIFKGELVSFNEKQIVLTIQNCEKIIIREKIAHIVPVIEF